MAEVLRVILNVRPLRATLTGVGVYTQRILNGLPLVEPAIRVSPFAAVRWRRQGPVLAGGAQQGARLPGKLPVAGKRRAKRNTTVGLAGEGPKDALGGARDSER